MSYGDPLERLMLKRFANHLNKAKSLRDMEVSERFCLRTNFLSLEQYITDYK